MPLMKVCPDIDEINKIFHMGIASILDKDGNTVIKKIGVFGNMGRFFNPYFWHYYDNNDNTIKFSFYDKLFVIVKFE